MSVKIIQHLVKTNYFGRSNYAYGLMLATVEAMNLQKNCITVFEFGVAQGGGLLSIVEICNHISIFTGMKFRIVGFDSGVGLLSVDSHVNHPEIWKTNQFAMENRELLLSRIAGKAEIVFGDINETVPVFVSDMLTTDMPVGFASIDVDTYDACVGVLKIFLGKDANMYLPAVPVYVDDVHGVITYNDWCGEALAIKEFNDLHDMIKIQHKLVRTLSRDPAPWHHHYYFCNFFAHDSRQGKRSHAALDMIVDDY